MKNYTQPKNSMFSFFQNQELNGAISGTNDESSYKSKYNTEGYLFRRYVRL